MTILSELLSNVGSAHCGIGPTGLFWAPNSPSITTSGQRIIVEIDGVHYLITVGSDLDRDGMYLEATIQGQPAKAVAEIFYSDASAKFTVSCFEESIPLELLEHLVAESRRRLPPSDAKVDG